MTQRADDAPSTATACSGCWAFLWFAVGLWALILLFLPNISRRFDDDEELVPVLDVLGTARGLHVIVSEYEQVQEQAGKVRAQLESSFGEASSRGNVAARPPDESLVRWLGLTGPTLITFGAIVSTSVSRSVRTG